MLIVWSRLNLKKQQQKKPFLFVFSAFYKNEFQMLANRAQLVAALPRSESKNNLGSESAAFLDLVNMGFLFPLWLGSNLYFSLSTMNGVD